MRTTHGSNLSAKGVPSELAREKEMKRRQQQKTDQ